MTLKNPKDSQGSRERVLSSATEEFGTYGFAGARIDRIARRVKLNVRMIYYHFGSKEGLYRGVLRDIYEQSAALLSQLQSVADPEQRSLEAIARYMDFLTHHPHFSNILVRELLDGGEHLKALFAEEPVLFETVHMTANALVSAAIEAGEFRELPPGEVVLIVTWAMLFLFATRNVHGMFLHGRQPSAEEWRMLLTDVLLNGVRKRG